MLPVVMTPPAGTGLYTAGDVGIMVAIGIVIVAGVLVFYLQEVGTCDTCTYLFI